MLLAGEGEKEMALPLTARRFSPKVENLEKTKTRKGGPRR
jgi:hypothetical protein